MKFALVHLAGSHRGDTQYFDRSWLTLGSAPTNDVAFPADDHGPVAPLHAEIFEVECEMRLRCRDPGVETRVNGERVTERPLHDRDLIQLGPNGPRLRFRIRPEEFATCKLVREIIQDARDVATEGRPDGGRAVWSFVGQVAYDIRRNATRTTQGALLGLLAVLVGLLSALTYYTYTMQRAHEQHIAVLLKELESARLNTSELERRIQEERRRMVESQEARQAEMDQLVARLEVEHRQGASQDELKALQSRLQALEREREGVQALIQAYGSSVGFLYVAFGFVDKRHPDRPPEVQVDYMGTGFLIDSRGHLVTNRHIIEPWTMDPSSREIMRSGFEPTLLSLLAYFPGQPEPFPVTVVRMSNRGDVALGRLSSVPRGMEPIPIPRQIPRVVVGEPVVILGYPVGIEGIIARMEDQAAQTLLQQHGHKLGPLVRDIAAQGGIRPLSNQGHVSDLGPGRIIYDAQTTGGGSGSPVFNSRGEVIAVNAATMTRFAGASFGVPIGLVQDLLPGEE